MAAHVRTWAHVPVGALVCMTNTPGRKKGALISSHSELLDGNSLSINQAFMVSVVSLTPGPVYLHSSSRTLSDLFPGGSSNCLKKAATTCSQANPLFY